jgi:tetratricopeptide (TPR) repeat protein
MHPELRVASLLLLSILLLPSPVRASGGSSVPSPPMPSAQPVPEKSPELQAIEYYNAGVKNRDKALELEKEAAQTTGEKERAKLEKKARKEFEKAIFQFQMATGKNPNFYQAYSDLGFSRRKIGDYNGALEAYNRSLSLAPGYALAVEYRAEAYLALERVEDAKQAYVELFSGDRGRADELMKAMKGWIEKRRIDPGKMSPDALKEFAAWVEQREQIAKQTPSLSALQLRNW